jgi:cytochrome b pre-mRNA-processing protein 3
MPRLVSAASWGLMFKFFRGKSGHDDAVMALYSAAVRQARTQVFYERYGVADTPDGRFDMIMLHVYLLLRRLKDEGRAGKEQSQALFDLMFDDMDQNLREMGAGDIGVSYRIKDMAKAFYGRIAVYDSGLAADGDDELAAALQRNLYRKTDASSDEIAMMAAYVRAQAAALAGQDTGILLSGNVDFAQPVEGGETYHG